MQNERQLVSCRLHLGLLNKFLVAILASFVFYFLMFLYHVSQRYIYVLIFVLDLLSGPNSYLLFLILVSIFYSCPNFNKICKNVVSLRFIPLDQFINWLVKLYEETHRQSNLIYLIF